MHYKLIKVVPPRDFKKLRHDLGYSQKDMAGALGISRKSYRMIKEYERGNTNMLTSWRSWEHLENYLKEIGYENYE